MAQYENLGVRYFAVYRSPVRRWFPVGNWYVLMGTVVIRFMDRIVQLQMAKFNLVAHKWSKDFKEKFPSANSGFTKYEFRNLQHESLNPTRCRIEYIGG